MNSASNEQNGKDNGNNNDSGQRGKHDGAGPEGTIPDADDGVGATVTEEPTNFEPEEDRKPDSDERDRA